MAKLRIEKCTRCKKGDVSIEKDQYGWYEYCLQCGYIRDLPVVVEAAAPPAGKQTGNVPVESRKKGG